MYGCESWTVRKAECWRADAFELWCWRTATISHVILSLISLAKYDLDPGEEIFEKSANEFPLGFEASVCVSVCISYSVVSDSLWPMGCGRPGSSVRGILWARIPEWFAISFSRESSHPRDQTWASCIVGRFFTIWNTRKPKDQVLNKKTFPNDTSPVCFSKLFFWFIWPSVSLGITLE